MKFKLNKNKLLKVFLWILGIVIWFYVLVWLYSFIFERDALNIDRYNFQQLERAKPILESMDNVGRFYWLEEFNTKFQANIKPIKNCYFVGNYNWNKKYIFW